MVIAQMLSSCELESKVSSSRISLHNTQRKDAGDLNLLRLFQLQLGEDGNRSESYGDVEHQVDNVHAQISLRGIATSTPGNCRIPSKCQRLAVKQSTERYSDEPGKLDANNDPANYSKGTSDRE
jgi:hypothetical protein